MLLQPTAGSDSTALLGSTSALSGEAFQPEKKTSSETTTTFRSSRRRQQPNLSTRYSRPTGTVEFRGSQGSATAQPLPVYFSVSPLITLIFHLIMSVPKIETDKFDGKSDFIMW
ncbi:hypothetical protein M9H77_25249 [Catharanthus roseus]|uniref:Uncharacterized protein n=1 Tax=Catharanthus roseus TaxID=4058 RepID=A0ACC0A6Q5_CATRO|nr:hypothetical protein M9H77_25249 [Catharanthus roseus]